MFLSKTIQRVKESKRYRKSVGVIPSLFTFANALCGFVAVIFAFEGALVLSASCIILAAIFDGVDGRLARAFDACSPFGAELDSLCDAVSFCFAPAMVMYSANIVDAGPIGVAVLGIYMCAGLFRLARFNVQPAPLQGYFCGLPVPVAACLLASVVLYHEWLTSNWLYPIVQPGSLCVLILALAFLMGSRIPFPSFKSQIWSRSSAIKLMIAAIIMAIGFLRNMPIFFLFVLSYVVISLVQYVRNRAK